MNLSALTAKEVLRMCQPETDLEKRLFEIMQELSRDCDDAISERDSALYELENSVSEDDYYDLVKQIRVATLEIDSGKVSDARLRLVKLL